MKQNSETEILSLMASIHRRYFPDLEEVSFELKYDVRLDGVAGQALFEKSLRVILHYSDARVLEPKYRMGLVPIIAHELAHFINPVDPEEEMGRRLPAPVMSLWRELLDAGYAKCSFNRQGDFIDSGEIAGREIVQ